MGHGAECRWVISVRDTRWIDLDFLCRVAVQRRNNIICCNAIDGNLRIQIINSIIHRFYIRKVIPNPGFQIIEDRASALIAGVKPLIQISAVGWFVSCGDGRNLLHRAVHIMLQQQLCCIDGAGTAGFQAEEVLVIFRTVFKPSQTHLIVHWVHEGRNTVVNILIRREDTVCEDLTSFRLIALNLCGAEEVTAFDVVQHRRQQRGVHAAFQKLFAVTQCGLCGYIRHEIA